MLKSYLVRFLPFVILVAGLLFAYQHFSPAYRLAESWWLLGFFIVVAFAAHLFIVTAEDKRPAVFVRRFMLTTTLRLFIFIAILGIYSFTHRDKAVSFILYFLAFYIAFTGFEVGLLYRHFRTKK